MRAFSEAEVADILRRASERQAEAARAVPDAVLTLADLERIAEASGLDAAHVRAAAAEVAARPATVERSRSATHVFVETVVPVPLAESAWEDVVADLQNRFGKPGAAFAPGAPPSGDVSVVGRNREWAHTDGTGIETRALVSDRGDHVRLRLSQRVGMGSEWTDAFLVMMFAGWAPAALGAWLLPGPNALWIVLGLVLTFVATYAFDRTWRPKMHDRLDALARDLAAHLAAGAPAALDRQAAAAPALPLDALGEAPETETPRETRERTR